MFRWTIAMPTAPIKLDVVKRTDFSSYVITLSKSAGPSFQRFWMADLRVPGANGSSNSAVTSSCAPEYSSHPYTVQSNVSESNTGPEVL